VSLLICLTCGHPLIYHTQKGCTEMFEADTDVGWDWCPCEQPGDCDE
jgi:hypothetical protein